MSNPEKKPLISIALLLREARRMDLAAAEHAVTQALRGALSPSKAFPMKDPKLFAIQAGPVRLGLINADAPYFKDREGASRNTNVFAVRQAVLDHKAWMGVDYVGGLPPDTEAAKIYPILGLFVAELLSDDVLALIRLPHGPIVAYDFSFIPLLRTRQVDSVFSRGAPDRGVRTSRDSDAELAAATAEAKRRWSEFVAAFASRSPGQDFAVKLKFTEDEKIEHMWVAVTAIDGDIIHGWLNNTPHLLTRLKVRDPVVVKAEEIVDWIYTEGPRTIGGFQAAVFQKLRGGA